jgi:hypothetical protein
MSFSGYTIPGFDFCAGYVQPVSHQFGITTCKLEYPESKNWRLIIFQARFYGFKEKCCLHVIWTYWTIKYNPTD